MKRAEAERIVAKVTELLAKERERRDLSFYKLGPLAGPHETTVSLIEGGERTPAFTTCLQLANALGVPLWKLLKQAEELSG